MEMTPEQNSAHDRNLLGYDHLVRHRFPARRKDTSSQQVAPALRDGQASGRLQ